MIPIIQNINFAPCDRFSQITPQLCKKRKSAYPANTIANLELTHLSFDFDSSQCHVSSVPVYSSLKKRTLGQFTKVIIGALTIGFIAYTLAGIYGGLTFGRIVCSDILLSYRADDVPVTVARCMILCNMLTTYPVLQFCGR